MLSIVSFVESTLHRVIGPEPGVPPATPMTLAASQDQAVPTGLAASAMKTQLKLTLSVEISLVSILCLVNSLDSHTMHLSKMKTSACIDVPLCMTCSLAARLVVLTMHLRHISMLSQHVRSTC